MVKIICLKPVSGRILVTGFQGLGYVGSLSIDHLVEALKAKRIGYMETTHTPPIVYVRGRKIQLPYEIYEHGNLLIFRFEGMFVNKSSSILMREVVRWAKNNGVEKMILIGGLNKSYREGDKDHVRFIANKVYERIYGRVEPIVQDGIQIWGPLALLLNYAEIYDVPALALLAYADPDRIDPRGAVNALKALSSITRVKVNVSELMDKAEEIERELSIYESSKKEGGRETKNSGMYA